MRDDSEYASRQRRVVHELVSTDVDSLNNVSIVSPRDNYRNDPSRCLAAVVFVPTSIGKQIESRIIEPLRAVAPEHYYYPAVSMHVTVQPVRVLADPPNFCDSDVQRVDHLFQEVVPGFESFAMSFEELLAFPTSVSLVGYCDDRLHKLVSALSDGLRRVGLPCDKQYISDEIFFGNVTLCRYTTSPTASFLATVHDLVQEFSFELTIKDIELVTADVVCTPESRKIWNRYTLSG